jgi:hypothetical protein
MRSNPFRLLLLSSLALTAAGCEDTDSPFESPAEETPAPHSEAPVALASARWADAYLLAGLPEASSYTPDPTISYNRGGGPITITKAKGAGLYVATFRGLSRALGGKSTVYVTAFGADDTFCKPMNGHVLSDKIEVRCLDARTGAPRNATFSLVVLRKTSNRAFAFAHQPTNPSYSPKAAGSWNPAGTIKVTRSYMGYYQVTFNNLGASIPAYLGGHVQVHTVASGKAHCKASEQWGGSPNLSLTVQCYTPAGQPIDAKFNVLFQLPEAHLAFAYVNRNPPGDHAPNTFWSSNPSAGGITVRRLAAGIYTVTWAYLDPQIFDYGNAQVTPLGYNDYALCKLYDLTVTSVGVKCHAPNGVLADTWFTVMLGS